MKFPLGLCFQHDFQVMHSSKPAQGKGVDSCQFRGVWGCLVQLGSSTVKDCRSGAASPFPWTLSPFWQPARQQTGWKVPFDLHGDGTPFSASKLLSRFLKVCVPGLENLPYPKSRFKANSCVSGSARQPYSGHTHMHRLWHEEAFGAVSCMHDYCPNMKTTLFDEPLNLIMLSN